MEYDEAAILIETNYYTKRNFTLGQCVVAEISYSFCAVGFGKCR